MEIRLLGPVEVIAGRQRWLVGPPQRRLLLAVLAADAGHQVSVDTLVDRIWEEGPPPAARRAIHAHVARLRHTLAGAGFGQALVGRSGGYLLQVTPSRVDLHRFRHLVGQARSETVPVHRRLELLWSALELWHGDPLAGLGGSWTCAAREAWRRERLDAMITWAESAFTAHGADHVIAPVTAVLAESPLCEPLAAVRIRALHAAGRTSEALECYAGIRGRLVEELGTDPGPVLRDAYLAVLRDEAQSHHLVVPPGDVAGPVPAQLPPDVRGFAGRLDQLRRLDAMLGPDRPPEQVTVVISVVSGTAGVGKTALAVHWAHRVADRFPDGQLYVNLRGFDRARPAAPADAVRGFLDALGVPAQRIPSTFDAQIGLYRSLLAGRRVMILLDNARDADQVRPLLPGTPTALVLVTSRNRLPGLVAIDGAHPVALDLLSQAEARTLLANRLGAERVAAETRAVDNIIDRSARLPLALVVVAAQAAMSPQFPLHAMAAGLTNAGGDLPRIGDDDVAGDVRSVFSWSYRLLSPPAARLFRLLGLHPGPDIGRAAAASLAGLSSTDTDRGLTELTNAHLLAEPVPGRFAFHDLLRAYATGLAQAEDGAAERDAAIHRLIDHYLVTSDTAAMLMMPQSRQLQLPQPQPGVTPERIDDYDGAMAWFDAECQVLLAVIERAAADGFDVHVWQLVWSAWRFLEFRGLLGEWRTTAEAAVYAADRLGDPRARKYAHTALALAFARLEHYDEARTHLQHAVDQHAELRDDAGYARLRLSQGWVAGLHGCHAEALHHGRQALEVFRQLGDRLGTAHALASVSRHYNNLGDHRRGLDIATAALAAHGEIDDPYGRADTFDCLGSAHYHLGAYPEAVASFERAVALHRSLGDRYAEADTLHQLGVTHSAAGTRVAAVAAWRNALTMLDELGHPDAGTVRARLHGSTSVPNPSQ